MSIARQLLHEFRPLFQMLDGPVTRAPTFSMRSSGFFPNDPFFHESTSRPGVELYEEGKQYVLEANVPGVKKQDIEVRVGDSGRTVTIEGKIYNRRVAETEQGDQAQAQDSAIATTPSTSFTRTVWLPQPVDGGSVSAQLTDGVLTITVPKVEDKGSVVVPIQ